MGLDSMHYCAECHLIEREGPAVAAADWAE